MAGLVKEVSCGLSVTVLGVREDIALTWAALVFPEKLNPAKLLFEPARGAMASILGCIQSCHSSRPVRWAIFPKFLCISH